MCSWELFSSAAFSLISFKVADYWLVCVLRQELTTLESCSNKNTCLIFTLSDSPMTQCHNNQTQKWTQSDKFHMFHNFHTSERTHVRAYPHRSVPTSLFSIIQEDQNQNISHINGSSVASSRFEEESGAWDAKGGEVGFRVFQHLVKWQILN